MKRLLRLTTVAALLGLPLQLRAQLLIHSPTGLTNPTSTFDFNSMASGYVPGVLNGVDFGGQLATGAPGTCGGNFSTMALFNVGCAVTSYLNPLVIRFTVPTSGFAANLITNSGFIVMYAWYTSGLTWAQGLTPDLNAPDSYWFGGEGGPIDRVEIFATQGGGYIGIDNLQVTASNLSPVPEPGTGALAAAGFLGVVALLRRRRRG